MTEPKLKRLATFLHGATLACQIALPIVLGLAYVALSAGAILPTLPNSATPSGVWLWLGVTVGFLPALALFWALDVLRRLFARYREGEVLTEGSAILIRQAGKALLLLAALKIAVQPVQSVLLTWQSPPGARSISVGISHADIGFLLLAGLLTVIGWAMSEAARAADENRAFV